MVDIRNIKWNGKYAVADLSEDGSKEIAYTIEVDEIYKVYLLSSRLCIEQSG